MKHAKEAKCNRIEFYVSDTSPARTFYEKLGAINITGGYGQLYYRIIKDTIDKVDQ